MHAPVYGKAVPAFLRRLVHPAAELLHVTVVYLGIAALVTSILALSVPSLRGQLQQAHKVLAAAIKPDGFRPSIEYAAVNAEQATADPFASISPVMASDELTWSGKAQETAAAGVGADQAGTKVELAHLSFTRALADSQQEAGMPGVTAGQARALRSYIARKYKIAGNVAGALIQAAFAVGHEMDLDPQLLLAVIAIESRYNPYAESHMGAQGLMQVMTRVHEDKFAAFGEGPMAAVHPLANIRVGAQILSDCIKRRGSLDGGLACYVGATGPSDGGYGAKVKAERRRVALASGIPIKR